METLILVIATGRNCKRTYLHAESVHPDMRNSFTGLYALARHGLQQDPLSGHLFVFVNRRGTQVRILYFDRSGWCIWAKRLEAGLSYFFRKMVRTRAISCLKSSTYRSAHTVLGVQCVSA